MSNRDTVFVPIDDLEIEVDKEGLHCELEWKLRCENVFKISGTDMQREFESASIRHEVVRGLQASLKRILPNEMLSVGLNTRVREILVGALTNEPYLMQVVEFVPIEKQGSAMVYPPDGRFLDVSVEIDDEWKFLLVDGKNVRFVVDEGKRTTPERLLFASEMRTSEYGYLPAKQVKKGISVDKVSCPKPKLSPLVEGKRAFCMMVHPKGHVPDSTECGGYGGYADGMTVCRYLRKMTARKQDKK
jgi:hypothetical protein